MAVTFIPITFVLIFLQIFTRNKFKAFRQSFINSTLILSIIVFFITEGLSLFHGLSYQNLIISWGLIIIFFSITVAKIFKKEIFAQIISRLKSLSKLLSGNWKWYIFLVLLIVLLSFVQGIIYPPNTADSMTYHMARIVHWVANHSVAHYPSNIYRQIYQPPFAEYIIANINLLARNDIFSNTVEWFAYINGGIAISLISKELKLSKDVQILSAIILMTTTEIILQSSSTKNDIVVGLFSLSTILYGIKSYRKASLNNIFFLGLSAGLGILTKGTGYIYIGTILFIWGIITLLRWIRKRTFKRTLFYPLIIAIILAINSGHYCRNIQITNVPLGLTKELNIYSNKNINLSYFFSNVVRNISLHFGPYPLSIVTEKAVYLIHDIFKIDPNNRLTTFQKEKYEVPQLPNSISKAPNLPYALMFTFVLFLLITRKIKLKKQIYVLLGTVSLQFFLFCLILKWQPYHTRLHTPMFMAASPIIAAGLLKLKNKRFFNLIVAFVFLNAFIILIFNRGKPFLFLKPFTKHVRITDSRFRKQFAYRSYVYEDYKKVLNLIGDKRNDKLGLNFTENDYEYPLFTDIYKKPYMPTHINVKNPSNKLSEKNLSLNFIISSYNVDTLVYNNSEFYNITPKNSYLFLLKPKK